VASGTDTLDLFDTNNYDVILLDCNLEDMAVRDIVDQIRRKEQLSNQHVPILIVCTTAREEEQLRDAGVSQILIKGRGFINRDLLMQALLRSVNIIPSAQDLVPPKELFDTSEMVDSLFLAQISRSSFFAELFQLFIGCTERIVVMLTKYLKEGDARGLVIEAHNCSSISANIGAVWLSRLATDLRITAGKVDGTDLPPELYQMVDRVIQGVDITLNYLEKCNIIKKSPEGKWIIESIKRPFLNNSLEISKDGVGKTRVLVVDDMPMTQFIVTTLLSKSHFTCETVSNGIEAIAAIEKTKFDFVLMDVFMDRMSGIDATKQLRMMESRSNLHLPVIGLTSLVGDNAAEIVPQLIESGMDDVIFKPILRNSFLSRLEIWRPQLSDSFSWAVELDTVLLAELASSPSTLTEIVSKIIELSNRVASLITHVFSESPPSSPSDLDPIQELVELCVMVGACRMAEVAKLLYEYSSLRQCSRYTQQRLTHIYAEVRAGTIDALNRFKAQTLTQSSETVANPVGSPVLVPAKPDGGELRMLIADDQPLTRMLITSMVNKAFPNVVIDTADSGETAVSKADSNQYDLILMDISMPRTDGYRAAQLIRASEVVRKIPPAAIVAITAKTTTKTSDTISYQEAGMNELVHKPLNNHKLVLIFQKYIFDKDKAPSDQMKASIEEMPNLTLYPPEMLLNSEILDMLRGLGILDRTVETFEKHSKELLQRARSTDPSQMQKRSTIRQSIHALKGISLNSGASVMGTLCDDLERVILDCDKEAVVKMLDLIEAGFVQAMKRFREIQVQVQ
jgi:CheY-like chemotaxis protein/HPt (histidine-containing phosphotransfer) domain-containing protein